MTANRVALIDWDESHVDVPDLDLVLPHNAAGLDDGAHDIAAQASAAWEAAVCWDDDYAVKRLAIQLTRSGRGFLVPDAPGLGEIQIRAGDTGTAFPDDRVLVRRNVRPRGMRVETGSESGTVVRVLERRRTHFVGTLKRTKQFLCVTADDPRIGQDIFVPPARDVGRPARAGDKVMVEVRAWESDHSAPEGVITEVLGPPTAEGVDMLSVLRQYDLPLKFPASVLREAKRFGAEVSERDLAGRTDCRDHPVITIDPADAKDFDDAICLERSGEHEWKLWVHIADVSHYVKRGSALDKEARERGNSTYLVDRVIPMLPEEAQQWAVQPETGCRPSEQARRVRSCASTERGSAD